MLALLVLPVEERVGGISSSSSSSSDEFLLRSSMGSIVGMMSWLSAFAVLAGTDGERERTGALSPDSLLVDALGAIIE